MEHSNERMTMEEIQEWIDFRIAERAKTWRTTVGSVADQENHAQSNIPHSDLNSAQELYKCFEHLVHFIPNSGEWHIWNGVFHEKIDGNLLAGWICVSYIEHHKRALSAMKLHYEVQAGTLSGDAKKAKLAEYTKHKFGEHREYRDRIHNNGGITGLTTQIKAVFSVVDSFFDEDRRWLVLTNGVIDLYELRAKPPIPGDLAGIKLLPHDSARPVWRQVNAELDPKATAPRWRSFLEHSLPDAESRKFLAVCTGTSLAAEGKVKIIPVLKGPTNSGKSTYLTRIYKLVGGYGHQPNVQSLNKAQGTNFEQDGYRGRRFVAISEPDTDRKVDDTFVKQFTGGDEVYSRNLHARSTGWYSQGMIFIGTNNDLKMNTNDKSILSRFTTIFFPNRYYPVGQIPKGQEAFEMDKMLDFNLELESNGILSWILNGLLVYLSPEGMVIPAISVEYMNRQYIDGSTVNRWVEEFVRIGLDNFVVEDGVANRPKSHYMLVGDLHDAYFQWAACEGEVPLGKQKFSAQLIDYLGVIKVESGGTRIQGLVSKAHLDPIGPVATDNY